MILNRKVVGGGSEPTGTITITQNGSYDVSSYATAVANVGSGSANVETGTFTPAEDTLLITVNHNFGKLPDYIDVQCDSADITDFSVNSIWGAYSTRRIGTYWGDPAEPTHTMFFQRCVLTNGTIYPIANVAGEFNLGWGADFATNYVRLNNGAINANRGYFRAGITYTYRICAF